MNLPLPTSHADSRGGAPRAAGGGCDPTRRRFGAVAGAAAFTALVGLPAVARDGHRSERLPLRTGAREVSVQGRLHGDDTVDYLFAARRGQVARVRLTTRHPAASFNLIAPGERDTAFFNGSVAENRYDGTLPASGDYRIRVYLMRSAARRHEVAPYRLELTLPGGATAVPTADDARVPGSPYQATGEVACAQAGSRLPVSCPYGVVRSGAGSARVTIRRPDGTRRTIVFERGRATGVEAVRRLDLATLRTTRRGDVTVVHIGAERYEIPNAVIDGD